MSAWTVSNEQKEVLRDLIEWQKNPQPNALTLGGYAGTGKTTLIAFLRLLLHKRVPNLKVALTAYTGKATRVLEGKLYETGSRLKQDTVCTLHSLLYSPQTSGSEVIGWRPKPQLTQDLIIVDEASMISSDLWADLTSYGVPVLAVGDHGQLPPVGSQSFVLQKPQLVLQTIHRQVADSPILKVATMARTEGFIPVGKYGEGVQKYSSQNSEAQLLIEEFCQNYTPDTLFLAGRNRTRQGLNASIRTALWRESHLPEVSDQVICLKNNWRKGLYNGQMGEIGALEVIDADGDGQPLSYLAEIQDEAGRTFYHGPIAARQFGAEQTLHLSAVERKHLGELFDYGYALTVHKAQGSQARRVIVIEERMQQQSEEDWRRWLYTAVTRAQSELFIFGSEEKN